MPSITLSHSVHATARLFAMKSLFALDTKCIIITDKDDDIHLLRDFANMILGIHPYMVSSLSELWMMEESNTGLWIIPSSILEVSGTLYELRRSSLYEVSRGIEKSPDALIEDLIRLGYTHSAYAGELSTYKREGSIVTLTDALTGNLIHIEWFDTEIDSIIEIESGSSERHFRDRIAIKKQNDTHEPTRSVGMLNTELWSLISQSKSSSTIFVIGCDFLPYIDILRASADYHCTDFHREGATSLDVEIPEISHIDALLAFLREQSEASIQIYTKFAKTVGEFLEFHALSHVKVVEVSKLGLESFMMDPVDGAETDLACGSMIVIADDIIGQIFVRTRSKKSIAKHLDLLLTLKPGDLVVHREHGIARFHAVIKKTLGQHSKQEPQEKSKTNDANRGPSEVTREYMELHYADSDKLFVPLTEIYRVSKYLGNPDIELTKLTGKEWERTMEKTSEEIEMIAQDILETSARRTLAKGRSFAKYRDREAEFLQAFPYEHTPDQRSAIEEVFRDMESEFPMDRLISGDVGFGKTEVAMNAIYKAVLSGTQVAVISPLLVLADEHYETFEERLGVFGVRIAVMTRMNTPSENDRVIDGLRDGTIDVVVGTHRLLSDDVRFKNLGLLIIDEEHKFGVTHKEKIKKLRTNLDILALSATPIPRSLNLALSGLKKISILATPPRKKKPIETIISRWSESVIAHAIRHEVERGGQLIILHNRIRGMESLEKEIQAIIHDKKIRIITTHGQMPGDQIEDRIHAFKKREYDILLTTTIIENGVNFLSANTIIIVDPEEFGLASLHQLRGRVGRKDEQGYCYLMYRKPELAKDEKERLITIANNSHLGAGFEIAMRDMELRGAGDVLGIKQSGRSKDVGLTLYFRLLEERIEEIKTQRKKREITKIELDISYALPDDLFLSEADKLNFFREIESVDTLSELEEIEKGMYENSSLIQDDTTRQSSISNLFLLLRTRLILAEYDVTRLSKVGINYVFDFAETTDVENIRRFLDRFDTGKHMTLLSIHKIRVETRYWQSPVEFLGDIY